MKKFFIIVLSICLMVSITACQSSNKKTADSSSATSPVQNERKDSDVSTSKRQEKRKNCDFRNAKWGDTKEDVKAYETEIKEFVDGDDSLLAGETTVSERSAVAIFYFDNGKLYRGAYAFDLNYSNAGQYIPVYNSLKADLTKKYGTPDVDLIAPLADEDLIAYAGESQALEFGYVQYGATWTTSTTEIMLTMGAQNFDILLAIQYTDKNYTGPSDNGL